VKAPFPWFGGKRRVAPVVWEAFGDPAIYVEPFFGSGAVLLNRPDTHSGTVETINDADGFVANVWRAIRAASGEVAEWADWPVNENDLHARHAWLVERRDDLVARLEGDPDYFDAKVAGWWLWGTACWIGGGFCSGKGPWQVIDRKLVRLGGAGQGVNRKRVHLGAGQGVNRQLVHLGDAGQAGDGEAGLVAWMEALAERLARVRVCCGDWSRVVTRSAMSPSIPGTRGVFFDPPYSEESRRDQEIYSVDSGAVAHDVREWCLEHGDDPNLRIALCGYRGEGHDLLVDHGWRAHAWSAHGGMSKDRGRGSGGNNDRETIWFSPACRGASQGSLFGAAS